MKLPPCFPKVAVVVAASVLVFFGILLWAMGKPYTSGRMAIAFLLATFWVAALVAIGEIQMRSQRRRSDNSSKQP